MTILEAMRLPALFGGFFGEAATWAAWEAFLAALFGLPMTEAQLAIYRRHTGRERPPEGPAREAWVVVGRRAGKSLIVTPGVYHLSSALNITNPNTVVLGLGMATLVPDNGNAASRRSSV